MEHSVKLLSFNVINNPSSFEIQAFGINEKGKTYSLLIKNMKPFFYVKIGNEWDDDDIDSFINQIIETLVSEKIQMMKSKYGIDESKESEITEKETEKMNEWFDRNVDFSLVNKRKLYGFDNKQQHQFIKFEFNAMPSFYKLKNLWYKEGKKSKDGNKSKTQIKFEYNDTEVEIYEAEIPPLLRFFHIRDIAPCGWLLLDRKKFKLNYGKKKKKHIVIVKEQFK